MTEEYIFFEVDVGFNDIIEVNLDKQANVRVMDANNYKKYRMARKYIYYGGLAKKTPVHIKPPHQGHWYVVVDLGGSARARTVGASIRILRR